MPVHAAGSPAWRRSRVRLSLLLFLLVALFGLRAWHHRFTLDSRALVRDARVRSLDLGALFTTPYWRPSPRADRPEAGAGLYRPVSLTLLGLLLAATPEKELDQGLSLPVNLAGAFLLALGAVLRFLLFWRLLDGRRGALGLAFSFGLLGAIHPVVSEVAGTAVGLFESLAMALLLGALLAASAWFRSGRRCLLGLYLLLALLALLSKESAVWLVLGVPLLAWVLRDGRVRWSRAALPGVAVVLAWLGLRALVLGPALMSSGTVFHGFSISQRLASALSVLWSYDLPALFWPLHLLPVPGFFDLPPRGSLLAPYALLGLLLVLLWMGLLFFSWHRDRVAAFGLVWFGATLFLVSNLLFNVGALAGTRLLYLPWTGLVLALAALCTHGPLLRFQAAGLGVMALLVCLLGWVSLLEMDRWRDEPSLCRTTLEHSVSALMLRDLALEEEQAFHHQEALELLQKAAWLPLPRVPGSHLVPERELVVVVQCALDAGGFLLQARRLEEGLSLAARAISLARQARSFFPDAPSRRFWNQRRAQALSLMGALYWSRAQKASSQGVRRRALRLGQQALEKSLALAPRDFMTRLRYLVRYQLQGDQQSFARGLANLERESRPLWSQNPLAARVGLARGRYLVQQGRWRQGLALELACARAALGLLDGRAVLEVVRAALKGKEPSFRQAALRLLKRLAARPLPPLIKQRARELLERHQAGL